MGYDSKAILDDIHKADPLPSKGKIDKKTKLVNLNKSFDALLDDDEYATAEFIYFLITKAFGVNLPDLYDPRKDAMNSKALESLSESNNDYLLPTPLDNLYKKVCLDFAKDNKDMEYTFANRVLQFYGYNIDGYLKNVEDGVDILIHTPSLSKTYLNDTEGQTKFIRSANHLLFILSNKEDNLTTLEEKFKSFEKVFKEVGENFRNKHFNDDVKIGADIYVINAFGGLINKVCKLNNKNLSIKILEIPKDKKAPEKEKSLAQSNAILDKIKKSKIGQFFNKVVNNPSIKMMARKLVESVEGDSENLKTLQTLDPERFGKYQTFSDLENEWKTDHCKQLDERDNKFITDILSKMGTSDDLKRYWDKQEDLTDLFETVSRQLYYLTDKKDYLLTWDKKSGYLCMKNDEQFSNYVSHVEFNNRQQDSQDMDAYKSNREQSGVDDLLSQAESDGSELFEKNYPSIKDYNVLKQAVDMIASTKPGSQVIINDEIGVCIIKNQEDIDWFKQFQQQLTEENQATWRWQIYDKLKELMVKEVYKESIHKTAIQMKVYLQENKLI